MKKSTPIKTEWLGHGQHFIAADNCRFRLGTLVTGKRRFVVSTIGDYFPQRGERTTTPTEVGLGRKFETFVFKATSKRHACGCPVITNYSEIDSLAANDPATATKNHHALIAKYAEAALMEASC